MVLLYINFSKFRSFTLFIKLITYYKSKIILIFCYRYEIALRKKYPQNIYPSELHMFDKHLYNTELCQIFQGGNAI